MDRLRWRAVLFELQEGGTMELLILLFCVFMYFLPAIVAHQRRHVSSGAIFLVNLFLGWSIIGWIVCFAWACSGDTRQQVVILPPAYRR